MACIPLTDEQKNAFDEQGYILIKNFLSNDEVKTYVDRLEAIIKSDIEKPEDMLVMRDVMVAKGKVDVPDREHAIQKIQDIHNDEVFKGLLEHPKILDYAENWTGPNIKSIHNMIINKPPNIDGRHPLHQDMLYFPFKPAEKIIGIWISFSHACRENGTLAVIPGSHKGNELLEHEMPPHLTDINLAYLGAKDIDISKRVHVEANPGDALLFHPYLLHGTGRNRTQDFRRVFISHYAASECTYTPGGEEWAAIRHYELVRGEEFEGCL